ncbi:hypothetical protein FOXG_22817 [Fusarium oxysporum f. sp. lycopersici 4287]|uniref:Condensation domain-containing protein n=1 Tax=Fusarium oxysporum f. sp. lycopersici (strain 4287 / CBS 123668 / FGSC 9935 / NRRL 34936) TaxID=426428 RepID=A0A0J9WC61_FUSO4|nr:uncharacterized protein FOXG_22817 [Fusarium oxysporum f. sp. lycopersici 4287]KNB20423.1 hypothetical protein FOXG_22817 [Fusarium oxysporum f. sp. lycopersici 4287]
MTELGDQFLEWVQTSIHVLGALCDDLTRNPTTVALGVSLCDYIYEGLDYLVNVQLHDLNIDPFELTGIIPCSPLQEGVLQSSSGYEAAWIWKFLSSDGNAVGPHRLEAAEDGFVQTVINKPETRVAHLQTPTCPEDLLARQSRPKFTDDKPKHSLTMCRPEDGSVACRLGICHSLRDAYSISILLEDVISVYCGDVIQNVPQFSDVVRHIKRRPMSETLTFWTPFLHGVEPCHIPVSKLCQGGPELDIHNTISIPFESMTGVTEQCKQMGLTRSTLIHLAWALVLSYITGMDETCFGYMLSRRDVPVEGIDRVFGSMANMLINRVDLGEFLEAAAASIARNLKRHHLKRRRLFNTVVSLLRSNPSGAKRLYFAKYNQVSSHEFDFVLEGHLHPSTLDLALHYRTAVISHDEAQKADTVLIWTIQFLLSARPVFASATRSALIQSSESEASVRPQDRFFRYVTGTDRRTTSSFWKSQLAGLDPSDPTTRDRSTAAVERDQHMKLVMQDIGNHSGFSTEVLGRAAWSMVLSQVFDSEDVIFGAVISHRRADDLLGIKIFPGVNTSVVPIRAYLD